MATHECILCTAALSCRFCNYIVRTVSREGGSRAMQIGSSGGKMDETFELLSAIPRITVHKCLQTQWQCIVVFRVATGTMEYSRPKLVSFCSAFAMGQNYVSLCSRICLGPQRNHRAQHQFDAAVATNELQTNGRENTPTHTNILFSPGLPGFLHSFGTPKP